MAVELAKMYVSIIPSFQGGSREIEGQLGPAMRNAGTRVSREFSRGFSSQPLSAANIQRYTSEVQAASARLATARQREEDAAGSLRVAEARLAEVRSRALPGSSQLLAAEERAATAARRLAAAHTAAQGPAEALAQAQRQLERATEEAGRSGSGAATTYARGWSGLRARLGDSLRGAVRAASDGADREADAGGRQASSSFASGFRGGLAALGVGGGVAAVQQFLGSAITGASDMEQNVGALDSVFRESSAVIQGWAFDAATSVGLSRNEFSKLAVTLGAQLKNGGTAIDELAPKTNELITLGADLASMFGGTTSDAVGALSSALRGERDPIERYGISLTQARVDAEAAALGFEKVGGTLSQEASQAATL